MIDSADEVIVVADSSKFKRSGLAYICGLERVHKVITDSAIEEDSIRMLQKNNIEVVIVD